MKNKKQMGEIKNKDGGFKHNHFINNMKCK